MATVTNRHRIALIGLGGISQSVHLPLIARLHDRVQLAAVVDLSAQRTAEIADAHGRDIKQFLSVDQLLSSGEKIDGAVIASGGTHAVDAKKLLEAGVPVLAEKPLGYSLAEHKDLANAVDSSGLRVGYMKEYDPASREAKKLLENLHIRSVEVEVLHPADAAQLNFARLRPAATDVDEAVLAAASKPTKTAIEAAIGGAPGKDLDRFYPNVVLGSVIHDIALLRYLMGGIGTVEEAHHYGDEFPGSLFMRGQLKKHPAPWTLNWHFIAKYPEYQETVTIHHDEGTVQLVFSVPYVLNGPTRLNVVRGLPALGVERTTQTWPQCEAFETEWKEFLDLIEGIPNEASSLDESAADIAVGQCMINALASSLGAPLGPNTEAVITAKGNDTL